MYKRYDELKEGDVIFFKGVKEQIATVRHLPYKGAAFKGQTEAVVCFDFVPFDEEAEEILGSRSYGTNSGIGCLKVEIFER